MLATEHLRRPQERGKTWYYERAEGLLRQGFSSWSSPDCCTGLGIRYIREEASMGGVSGGHAPDGARREVREAGCGDEQSEPGQVGGGAVEAAANARVGELDKLELVQRPLEQVTQEGERSDERKDAEAHEHDVLPVQKLHVVVRQLDLRRLLVLTLAPARVSLAGPLPRRALSSLSIPAVARCLRHDAGRRAGVCRVGCSCCPCSSLCFFTTMLLGDEEVVGGVPADLDHVAEGEVQEDHDEGLGRGDIHQFNSIDPLCSRLYILAYGATVREHGKINDTETSNQSLLWSY